MLDVLIASWNLTMTSRTLVLILFNGCIQWEKYCLFFAKKNHSRQCAVAWAKFNLNSAKALFYRFIDSRSHNVGEHLVHFRGDGWRGNGIGAAINTSQVCFHLVGQLDKQTDWKIDWLTERQILPWTAVTDKMNEWMNELFNEWKNEKNKTIELINE